MFEIGLMDVTPSMPGMSRTFNIPENALAKFSDTDTASTCFAKQRFSNRLQAYLVSYVTQVASKFPIYD